MANFEPKWNLTIDNPVVHEGETSTIKLQISKNRPAEVSNVLTIRDDQYLSYKFTVTKNGETIDPRDYTILVGENALEPVEAVYSQNPNKFGSYIVKLQNKEFDLSSVPLLDVYKFNITFLEDGVWDGPESIQISTDYIRLITLIDNQIASDDDLGVQGVTTQTVTYNSDNDIWVTPDLTVRGELYTIGELSYGSDSTIFVQAFGKSRPYQSSDNSLDKSNRVYVPMYKLETFIPLEMPATGITPNKTYFTPNPVDDTNKKEITRILIEDTSGNLINSGLNFLSNGQMLMTMLYQSEPSDAYMKVKIVPMDYYEDVNSQYYVGKKFRSYQTWIAPNNAGDLDAFADPKPKMNHVYLLNDTSVYPYTVSTVIKNGAEKLLFEESIWKDMGYYDSTLGNGIVGLEKIFRVVINNSEDNGITFETDTNLGRIHVGEYFGHTVYPIIKAGGSDLITYTIAKTSPNDITKYNLNLSPDGTMIGTAYAKSSDFSANDDIDLEFDVAATAKNGRSAVKRFKLKIIRGLSQHTLNAQLVPSVNLERAWFECIASSAFNNFKYYRASDNHYGLQKVPRILLKENLVTESFNWVSLSETKNLLREGIIDTINGAPVPESIFTLSLGNYKVRSALDKNGNVLYDILYREVHSESSTIELSTKPTSYSVIDDISEFYGLRQNIINIVGSDVQNLVTDPDDLVNRGLFVDAQNGISVEALDTVPRYMNHPYEGSGAKKGMLIGVIVAYLQPGTGEAAFNELVRNGEHGKLLGMTFQVPFVQFRTFYESLNRYIPDTFMIPLKSRNLLE